MIKYYPLTRIKTNLYTRGGDFTTPDGKSYTGRYYTQYDGKSYTGANPAFGTNLPLTAIKLTNLSDQYVSDFSGKQTGIAILAKASTADYNNALGTPQDFKVQLTNLQPYYPVATPSDYQQGYFLRYFAKTVTGPQYVIEISQSDYANLQNKNVSPTMLGYLSTKILWQLTGPLKNTRVSQYQIIGGIYDTNKRTTEAAAVNFVGLLAFIDGNYTKFARITPDVAPTGSK